MALKLLIDEDSQDKILVELLRKAKHDVQTVNDAGLRTAADEILFKYAIANKRIVLTQNRVDFTLLALTQSKSGRNHPGLLLVRKDNNPAKDMSALAIVKAIKNLEKTKIKLANQIIVLNQYNY